MKVRYKGEAGWIGQRLGAPGKVKGGKILAFRFRGKDGKIVEIKPANPGRGHAAGDVIDINTVDERVMRHLAHDPRFDVIP